MIWRFLFVNHLLVDDPVHLAESINPDPQTESGSQYAKRKWDTFPELDPILRLDARGAVAYV